MNAPPLRVLIVDDEAPARARLRELLADCAADLPLETAGEAANGCAAVEFLSRQPTDVVLLDIRMPDMDGIEAAQHLLTLPQPPAVIFTTAYDVYAVQAFEVNAIDYLLKPVRRERLCAALAKAAALSPAKLDALRGVAPRPRTHLSVYERGRIHLVPVADILYLRAELKYVTVRTADREYLMEESLSRLEGELGSRFLRVHRSCLVAENAIARFEKSDAVEGGDSWRVALRGIDEKLPVSRRQQHLIKRLRHR
ncbi:MAG TPA: DNA-binding response regulator [Betaproteobacteria bacterium]|nr:DNA-binding response regulator [Betaproteobacteria bacterium]